MAPGAEVSCKPAAPLPPPPDPPSLAGTTTAGPVVISSTKGTAARVTAPKPTSTWRQPISGMYPAASGKATATPMPGPA